MNLWALVIPVTVVAIFAVVALLESRQIPRRPPRRDAGAVDRNVRSAPLRATANPKGQRT